VASGYLCDLAIGDKVRVVGPYGVSFLMPNHPGAKLLMICTGTGSAPMRAMTERRRRRLSRGERGLDPTVLRREAAVEELPYFGPLHEAAEGADRRRARLQPRARSAPRVRPGSPARARADTWPRLARDDDAFVYLCGHKRMEQGVLEALAEIALSHEIVWADLKQRLRTEGRLHVETY
jgi:benzoyl-CoA 2,3-dioxygenase component A